MYSICHFLRSPPRSPACSRHLFVFCLSLAAAFSRFLAPKDPGWIQDQLLERQGAPSLPAYIPSCTHISYIEGPATGGY
ncbi:hypothetical protein QC761_0107110 [Podospora bellae-mahoneyi]|uniref:Secreted protein n=1 Tax=Podospora bellae-mahoneyi TaxID=2093777 RepID=A0ABR0F8D7_9PEZI|nr:hypothetical protein QC761_0107110 [Podospora bellae-mahoneyi]